MDTRIKAAYITGIFLVFVTLIGLPWPSIMDKYSVTDRDAQNIAPQTEERVEQAEAPVAAPKVIQPQTEDSCKSSPPPGLIHLRESEEPNALLWSTGVWGSKNLLTFTIALAEIDTDHPAFGEFRIWLDPCKIDAVGGNHGYVDGARFQPAVGSKWASHSSPPLIIGQEAVIRISPNTGIWGLGNHP